MCGISGIELLVIIVAAIIFLGPEKLPELMKMAGKASRELRKLKGDLGDMTQELRDAVPVDEMRRQMSEDLQLTRARASMKQTEQEIDALRARLKQKVELEDALIGGSDEVAPLPVSPPGEEAEAPSTPAAEPRLDGPPAPRAMPQAGAGAQLVGVGADAADPDELEPLPTVRPASGARAQTPPRPPHGPQLPESFDADSPSADSAEEDA